MRIKGTVCPHDSDSLRLRPFTDFYADYSYVSIYFTTFAHILHNDRLPMAKINVQNTEITVISHNDDDYISLTDMARSQLQEHIIFRWLSLKSTIEYLGE